MQILLKFPIRERVKQFLNTSKLYAEFCTNKDNVQVVVSFDSDDNSITGEVIEAAKEIFPNIDFYAGNPHGKIAAVNRDLEHYTDWDILVLASDDMIPQVQGWDKILISEMTEHFPDTDGVLFHNDGYIGRRLNTMCILGRKYYERFGYIYHPEFKSLWADNLFMEVAELLGKQEYFDLCLFKHEHHSTNRQIKMDQLMKHNESFYYYDKKTYLRLKQNNFNLVLK